MSTVWIPLQAVQLCTAIIWYSVRAHFCLSTKITSKSMDQPAQVCGGLETSLETQSCGPFFIFHSLDKGSSAIAALITGPFTFPLRASSASVWMDSYEY